MRDLVATLWRLDPGAVVCIAALVVGPLLICAALYAHYLIHWPGPCWFCPGAER